MTVRVLHLIPGLGWGGAERQLVLNLSSLDRARFESFVCYLYPRHDRLPPVKEMGIDAFCLGLRSGRLQWPYAVARIRRLVRDLGIDVIHTSNYEADVIGGMAAKLSGVPAISTLTNIGAEPERLIDNAHLNRTKMLLAARFQGAILRRCHSSYVAVSGSVKRSSVDTLGLAEDRVRVIYRALSDEWFETCSEFDRAPLIRELGLKDAHPVLLNVGRLAPQKGQRYLIEAAAQCVDEFPRLKVLIAGRGYLLDSLTELRDRLGLQDRVAFLGPRNDVMQLLDLSDMFVFPSVYEGFGNAWLEAAARGKACIASDIGPMREGFGSGRMGLLVPPADPDGLAQAIKRLARAPDEAREMGAQAADSVRRRFQISHTIKQLEELYEDVVDTPGRVSVSRAPQSDQPERSHGA